MKKLVKIIFILLSLFTFSFSSHAQNEANLWYFGDYAGLDFNTGVPIAIPGFFHQFLATGNICDSLGNFLIASDGNYIYNRDKEIMLNGDLIDLPGATEGTLLLKKPGNNRIYYLFVTNYWEDASSDYGLYYSVIDLHLDNGLGGVTSEKDILLEDAWDATEKIYAVRHKNKKDVWIVTRNLYEARYTSFLLTETGLNHNGVYSPAIERDNGYVNGEIGISHDKKRLVAAFRGAGIESRKPEFEICNFNHSTGQIELLYTIRFKYEDVGLIRPPWGVEFSPDSKYLYLSVQSTDRERSRL